MAKKQIKTKSQKIKSKARRSLSGTPIKLKGVYVIDTSAIINKFLPTLIKKGLKGKIIIPNAVMAELENLANKGREEGFIGLEQIANLHKLKKQIQISFKGIRPEAMHIKYAKSGEIDAIIRKLAKQNKAILVTSDLVQAKSAQAYDIKVLFLRVKRKKSRKKSLLSKIFKS